ncbi:MAG: 16S rRNA (cytosine(967)-C(5))-methyltransferase RsmB, partial [FCB group bacterium]
MENEIISDINETIPSYGGVRSAAIKILSRFERSDAYLEKLVERELKSEQLNFLDRALLTEIVNGVVRWRWKLDWVLTGFYHGDYLKCLNIVKNALRVALYQILFLDRVPVSAAVNESVEVVKLIQGEKTAGIVNGVLRNIARSIPEIRYPEREEDVAYYLSVMYSHPRWMVKRWLERFGEEETENILSANNRRPFIPVRVNTLKATPDDIINFLNDAKIPHFQSSYLKQSIVIKTPKMDITQLEIFKDGKITVQDTSASLAASLANPKEGVSIIDLCSAPGGKAFFLAELMKDKGSILALDKYRLKLPLIEDSIRRLGINIITTLAADAATYESEEKFDIVFADVPCSGLGTISKKPDIKWKREREDLPGLVALQRALLSNAATLVKDDGAIVYSTCTTEPEENYENIAWFLANFPGFELDRAEKYLPEKVCKDGFMQTFSHI